jgi:membrane protease YdiL (CAAX protease family)
MPLAFTLGIGLGWVRERTGSTLPGVAFHVAQNSALLATVYFATGWH